MGLLPCRWTGTFFGRAILWITERSFLTAENFLFFVYTVRVSAAVGSRWTPIWVVFHHFLHTII
jgi:hypothetical protein